MNRIGLVLCQKSLQIVFMFLPLMVWNVLLLCEIWLGISFTLFRILSFILLIILVCSILTVNSFIIIIFKKESLEEIEISVCKPTRQSFIKSVIIHIPFVCILLLLPFWVFIVFSIVGFIYVLVDKNHYSMMERIYCIISKYFINKKENHRELVKTLN